MNPKLLVKQLKSFIYAFDGIKTAMYSQVNMVMHVVAATIALLMAWFYHISKIEFCIIIVCIALVISMELLNTAIEIICDFIHPNKHEKIKQIKDISAAAVLITAVAALVIGLVIFIPKFAH